MNRMHLTILISLMIFTTAITKNNTQLFDVKSISTKYNHSKEKVAKSLKFAQESMQPKMKTVKIVVNSNNFLCQVTRRGVGILETAHGKFYMFDFEVNDSWKHYSVLVKASLNSDFIPQFKNTDNVTLRIDSGCLTGQLFGDQTCDCKEQLEQSMKDINQIGEGLIICIPSQDGRGMGLPFKLGTLSLQHQLGINTVESANLLAESSIIDTRTYTGAIGVLKFLGITEKTKICFTTNNPKKIEPFIENGYIIEKTIPIIIEPNEYTKNHLEAKKKYLGHDL